MTHKRAAFFYSSKVRGEGNSVIFINLEILPGPSTRVFVSLFLTTTRDFSEIQVSILLIMIVCEILQLLIFICFIFENQNPPQVG